MIRATGALSMLDVGGVGHYEKYIERYRCINVSPVYHCTPYAGMRLPYSNASIAMVLAESTLHHAADDALAVLREMVRVASRYVVIGEDMLERRASADVFEAFRQHDPKAIYRSLDEWMQLASLFGLRLRRVAFLHRVPAHVKSLATTCDLGFAPMVYALWEKPVNPACACQRRRRRPPANIKQMGDDDSAPANVWIAARRSEERAAGLKYTKRYG